MEITFAGTYFTPLPPDTDKERLLENNYDRSSAAVMKPPYVDKVNYVVEYKTTPGDGIEKVKDTARDIYKSEGDVELKSSDKIYKRPKADKKTTT